MKITDANYRDGVLSLNTVGDEAIRFVLAFKPGEYEIRKAEQKRSLDANGYMWTLCEELAKAVNSTKEDVYRNYIRQVGVYKDFRLTEDEAKTFRVAWGKLGTGWQTEQVDYTPDREQVIIRAYYGSSTYNFKRMSRLIDSIVEDCKSVGIETRPAEEIKSLLEAWHG